MKRECNMYENNWESLNKRKVPEWFGKAKFGIFIHWGLYSVPAFANHKDYAEWYGFCVEMDPKDVQTEHQRVSRAHHKKIYGDKPYLDFKNDFKGERFDAQKWATLFKRSGAKYINFVSKHHDGYCLYETKYAPNLNSVECAPKRDFLMELKNAMADTGVRFGVYHSVYEWWHPLCKTDPEKYALEHLIPMLKELVTKYEPNTLFTDGEWEHESSVWHSTDFLQWLYNESPVKDVIVPNDRWGKETRGRLGGNFTTEYGVIDLGTDRTIDTITLDRPFEECRGIGWSFGLNKDETSEDYLSLKELLKTLCSLVSKGGNFLLNIGPDADGTIPPIMEERLLGIGKWLEVNGEAIYDSEIYSKIGDNGIYYTKNGNTIYAITETFPSKTQIFSKIPYSENMSVNLLGSDCKVEICNNDGVLSLKSLISSPDEVNSEHLYTYKITI